MELRERDAELDAVGTALDAACDGDGRMLVLEGPAGIGKTGIVQAALALAGERLGVRVLSARAGELERDFPHGVVRQLVERPLRAATAAERDAWLGGAAAPAARMLGLGGPAPAAPVDDEGFAVMHGLYWLVANLSAEGPLVVAVDDVQWADASSLRFLAYLARRVEDLPVLLLVAARTTSEAGDPLLVQLLDDPAARRLAPRPLSVAATAALLADRVGAAPDPAFVAACHRVTHGNPFLLGQLAEAVVHDGLAPTAAGAAGIEELGPRTVARAILLRLGRLGPPALALARAVAVLGAHARPADAARLAGLDPADADRHAARLRDVDVLAADEEHLAFVHPIVRSAIYHDLPPGERALLHAAAALALRERGAEPAALGHHLLVTEPAGVSATAEDLLEAGRQARREGATATAVRLLERALAEPPADALRPAIVAALGEAEFAAGAPAAADHLAEALAATSGAVERARLVVPFARALAGRDGPQAATAALAPVIEEAADADRDLALRLEAEVAVLGGWRDAFTPALFKRLERHADLRGETAAECLILANRALAAVQTGGTAAAARDLARRALREEILLEGDGPESVPFYYAVIVLVVCDDLGEARRALDAAFRRARESGSAFGFGAASLVGGYLAYRDGDLELGESDSHAAWKHLADHAVYAPLILSGLVIERVERGRLDQAEAHLAGRGLATAPAEDLPATRLLLARAMLRLAQSRPADALADAREVERRAEALGLRDYEIGWRTLAALAHRRLGDAAAAQALAAEHLALCRGFGAPTPLGRALRVAGVVAEGDEQVALLEEAVALLADAPGRLEHAAALAALGAAHRRAGRRIAARDPLKAALDLATSLGATALADHAAEELAAAGAKPRRLQFSGVDALTASERRVAELAASGIGNRAIAQELFVTVKTVENHLSRVYHKLGIGSRADLPGALAAEAA